MVLFRWFLADLQEVELSHFYAKITNSEMAGAIITKFYANVGHMNHIWISGIGGATCIGLFCTGDQRYWEHT